jgi:hypothetical protein
VLSFIYEALGRSLPLMLRTIAMVALVVVIFAVRMLRTLVHLRCRPPSQPLLSHCPHVHAG